MNGVFVILDGVADEPCNVLNGKTPLERADTPNLDYFSHAGMVGKCFPIAEGVAPQSSSGIVSLFGGDYKAVSRGVLETIGAGVKLAEGDLALRCNFSTIDNLQNCKLIDRRAGRTLTTKEARLLADEVNSKVKLPYKFELIPTIGHRAILVFRGVFSSNFSNVDPDYADGVSVSADSLVHFSHSYDDSSSSKLSADLINTFVKKSFVILSNSKVNLSREKKGFFPANFLLCRDPGNKPAKFPKLSGKWIGFGYMPLEIGVSKYFGMDVSTFSYPQFNDMDAYAHLHDGLKLAIKNAISLLKKHAGSFDYFYVHFKETDIPGHDNKPLDKVKLIELVDKEFFGFLREFFAKKDYRLLVTADHTTSSRAKAHTANYVPFLSFDSSKILDNSDRFIEKNSSNKILTGKNLLKQTLLV
ncbi:MAG: alkaline phosphatase family protein [Candidatus Pacearchaeota archaeon]